MGGGGGQTFLIPRRLSGGQARAVRERRSTGVSVRKEGESIDRNPDPDATRCGGSLLDRPHVNRHLTCWSRKNSPDALFAIAAAMKYSST